MTKTMSPSSTLYVIDQQIPDWKSIVLSLPADSDIVYINPEENGLTVLAEELVSRSSLDAVHIFSHGQSGRVQLGSSWLDSETLQSHPALMKALADAITEDGDILIYGCEVAKGEGGESFVRELAHLTGSDVAASFDVTGNAELSGNWDLEYRTGYVSAKELSFSNYLSVLGSFSDHFTAPPFQGEVTSFTSQLSGVSFTYTFTVEGGGGSIAWESGVINLMSLIEDWDTTERFTIARTDGAAFIFSGIDLDISEGLAATVAGYRGGNPVGSAQTVPPGSSQELKFNDIVVDEVRITSTDFFFTIIDNFVGNTEVPPPPSSPPTLTATSVNPTFIENGSAIDLFNTVTANTNDDGQTFSGMTLTVTNIKNGASETLSIGGTGVTLANGNSGTLTGIGSYSVAVAGSTATVTLSGMALTNAQMGTLIDGITYANTSDDPGSASRVVTLTQVTDSGSTNNTASLNISSTVSVTPINDAPTATNQTQTQTYTENPIGAVALDDIVISDVDGGDTVTATLTLSNVSAGSLSTGTYGVTTSTYNAGTGVWSATGSVTDVNAALAAVSFTPVANWDQSVTITTRVRDAANAGPADGTITLDVTAVNDAPVITNLNGDSLAFTEGDDRVRLDANGNAVVVDHDSPDFNGGTLTIAWLSGRQSEDRLVFDSSDAFNISLDDGYSDGSVVLIGDQVIGSIESFGTGRYGENLVVSFSSSNATASAVQSLIRAAQYYSEGGDNPTAGTRVIRITVTDGDGAISNTNDISLTVYPENDAPVLDVSASPALETIDEDLAAPTRDSIANSTLISELLGGMSDVDSGAAKGVAITAVNATQGTLWYSVDHGEGWAEVGEVSPTSALLLHSNARVYWQPAADVNGTVDDALTFKAWDLTKGSIGQTFDASVGGGATAFSTASDTVSVTVAAINDAPTLGTTSLALVGTNEDTASAATKVSDLLNSLGFADVDGNTGGIAVTGAEGVGHWQYSIDGTSWVSVGSVTGSAALLLNENSFMRYQPDGRNGEDNVQLTLRAWDGSQGTATTGASRGTEATSTNGGTTAFSSELATVTLSVASVNDAPVLDTSVSPVLTGTSEDLAAPSNNSKAHSTQVSSLLSGVSDVDSGAFTDIAITGINTDQGTLWYSVTNGEGWQQAPEVAETKALLLHDSALLYWQPAANVNGTVSDAITFKAWDRTVGSVGDTIDASTGGGATAFSTASDTVSVTVTAVNDAPTLTVASKTLPSTNEDTASTPIKVSDLLVELGYADVDNEEGGIAITAAEGNGTWQYSLDGESWSEVESVDANAALLLDADTWLSYRPDGSNGEDNVVLHLRAWDGSAGSATVGNARGIADVTANGGETAYSSSLAELVLEVTDVNDAPYIYGDALTVIPASDEDSVSAVLQISSLLSDAGFEDSDVDSKSGIAITASVGNGTWEYSIDGGETWGGISELSEANALLLGSSGQLRYRGDGIRGETATLSYRAWDQSEGVEGGFADTRNDSDTAAFSSNIGGVKLTVTDVNDRPVLNTTVVPALTAILEDTAAPQHGVTLGTAQGATLVSSLLTGASDADGGTLGAAITSISEDVTLWFSTDVGKTWTAAANVAANNALVLGGDNLVYIQPGADKNGTLNNVLTFKAWDRADYKTPGQYADSTKDNSVSSGYSADTGAVTVTITAQNDAPVLTAIGTTLTALSEDDVNNPGQSVASIVLNSISDVDSGAQQGIAIYFSYNGTSGSAGHWEYSLNAGSTWLAMGTLSDSASLLLRSEDYVRFVPAGENSGSASISYRAWDQTTGNAGDLVDTSTRGGTSSFSTVADHAGMLITAVNDAPVLDPSESPTLLGISEDLAAPVNNNTTNSTLVSTLLGGVSDVDASASEGIAIVATNSTDGTLWYYKSAALTWHEVSGVTENNALLLSSSDRVYWQPAANKNGTVSDAFTFRAWDLSDKVNSYNFRDTTINGGSSSFSSATDTVSVTVTAVNDAPTLTATSKVLTTVNEDTTTTATRVSDLLAELGYADVDNDVGGIAITGAEGNGEWQYSTDGESWFDVASVDSSASLLLDANSLLRYVPDGKNGESNAQLDIRAWDGSEGTATKGETRSLIDTQVAGDISAFSATSATLEVAVTGVNDAPTLDKSTYTMTSITEDQTSDAVTISALLANAKANDVDTDAEAGVAITSAAGNGNWEYSTDTGKTWSSVASVDDSAALLLSSDAQLRYVGDGNNGEISTLTYRAWDQTTGNVGDKVDVSTTGGTMAFSSESASVTLVVTDVNDAPVLVPSDDVSLTTILESADQPEAGVTLGSEQGATRVSTLIGSRITDIDNADPGIAIISGPENGPLWFSTDAGGSWSKAEGLSDSSALLLKATDLVYYQGIVNTSGTIDVLTFRAWDSSIGVAGTKVNAESTGGTTAFSTEIQSVNVTVLPVNNAPAMRRVDGIAVDFEENDAAHVLFDTTRTQFAIGPDDESGQTLSEFVLTVDGVQDGAFEQLIIDGSTVSLVEGTSLVTQTNKATVSVSVVDDIATVTLSGAVLPANVPTLIQGLAYLNTSENPAEGERVVTLVSIKDNGGTENGGKDKTLLSGMNTTVTVTAVNDEPTGEVVITGAAQVGSQLKVTNTLEDLDGIGTFAYVWEADGAPIADATGDTLDVKADMVNKAITVKIQYTDAGGTDESIASAPTAKVTVPPSGTNVDGAIINETTQTAPDGSTINVVEIDVVTDGRQEQTGESALANVPVITQNGQTLLEVGLPTGVGMRVEEHRNLPLSETDPNGVTGLIAAIRARTTDALADQQEMTGVGGGFLDDLPDQGADLIVRTLVPTVGAGVTTPPVHPIKVTGADTADGRPVATVIDVRGLPSGTVLELDNIRFVAVIGEITMIGGAGSQVVTGDSKRQIIVLGEDNDIIRGGGGDDLIGSRGGEDRLYGDEGDDHIVGGAGNDHLVGGEGNDVLQGGSSDAGTWHFSLVNGELVSRFEAAHVVAADAASMEHKGPWWTEGSHGKETDNRLQFTYESVDRLKLVSTLYTAAVGELPDLMEYNHFVGSDLNDLQLATAAVEHWFASRILPQAIEVQVAALISAVWGENAVTEELITIGTDFITSGGSWGEGMLILARAVEAEQMIRTDAGELSLVQDLVTSETGRNQGNAGNDTLLGGAGNDRLVGGGGNNFLDGGEGIDVAVYTGALSDFIFQVREVDGVKQMLLTTLHTGHTDVLQNIELLKVGGNYFQLSAAIEALPAGQDYSLSQYVVELIAQQVQSLDLAGIY